MPPVSLPVSLSGQRSHLPTPDIRRFQGKNKSEVSFRLSQEQLRKEVQAAGGRKGTFASPLSIKTMRCEKI